MALGQKVCPPVSPVATILRNYRITDYFIPSNLTPIMEHSLTLWLVFNAFIILLLIVDLYVFNRIPHTITIRESLPCTGAAIVLPLIFGPGLYFFMGSW